MEIEAWNKLHSGTKCKFLGMEPAQFYVDLYIWELFFSQFHIRSMVELGTGQGGMTTFFILQSIQNRFYFDTFDINYPGYQLEPVNRLINFDSYFHLGDIFDDQKETVIKLLKNRFRPVLLYCDDGIKAKEADIFSPYLVAGDFLVLHDWNTEVSRRDIPHIIDPLEELLVEEREQMESLTVFFRKG